MAITQGAEVSNGSSYWTMVRDGFTNLVLDYGRSKFVDGEHRQDTNAVPDNIDLRYGVGHVERASSAGGASPSLGGLPVTSWLMIGCGLVVSAIVLKKFKVF